MRIIYYSLTNDIILRLVKPIESIVPQIIMLKYSNFLTQDRSFQYSVKYNIVGIIIDTGILHSVPVNDSINGRWLLPIYDTSEIIRNSIILIILL